MNDNLNIEILAPAGNFTALKAAVCGGANAVYLGLDHFNARRGADNFNIETLKDACDYAHLRNVKIYLTLNIIVFEKEFNTAMQMAYDAANAGIDAFIVQDIGLASSISKEIPHVPLHISTQMSIHDESGLRAVAKLGAKRVTLAREMSIDEIANICKIAKDLNIEIETFGHGALCICYSGQCLMSSMIGGRSANRGTCAQACRLNYELKTGKANLGSCSFAEDDSRGSYLLSPKDLCTIEILPKLARAGIRSLKIEGRMKSANYVYEVVNVYRRAIDNLVRNGLENYQVKDSEIKRLQEAFTRGFTTAYMEGKRDNEIMSYNRPNNRGINIGRVSGVSSKKIYIDVKQKIYVGDVLEVWTKHGRTLLKIDKSTKINDKNIELVFNHNIKGIKNIKKTDRVFRVRNSQNNFESSDFFPKVKIDCKLELKIGHPAKISFSKDDTTVNLKWDVVESAKTKSVTKDEVIAHIDRLGQTPFEINDFDIVLDENVGIGFSKLHKLRTDALNLLHVKLLDKSRIKLDVRKPTKQKLKKSKIKTANIFVSDDVFSSKEFCDSLGALYSAIEQGIKPQVGPHIPVVNTNTVKWFLDMGVSKIWLSPELSLYQIKDITKSFPQMSFGIFIMGPQELMITKHCVLMSLGSCAHNCINCDRRLEDHFLLDRKGYEFPVISDEEGKSHIYNSVSLDLCHSIDDLIDAGIDSFLVDTTLMDKSEAQSSIKRAMTALDKKVEKIKNTTTGHLFREVI